MMMRFSTFIERASRRNGTHGMRVGDSSEWNARNVGRLSCRNDTQGMRVGDSSESHAWNVDSLRRRNGTLGMSYIMQIPTRG